MLPKRPAQRATLMCHLMPGELPHVQDSVCALRHDGAVTFVCGQVANPTVDINGAMMLHVTRERQCDGAAHDEDARALPTQAPAASRIDACRRVLDDLQGLVHLHSSDRGWAVRQNWSIYALFTLCSPGRP